jgi:hypothetical protein
MRRAILLSLFISAAAAIPLDAQGIRTLGGQVGRTSTRQSWSLDRETEDRKGWTVGAFMDVQTPNPRFSVIVEGTLTRRGGTWDVAYLSSLLTADEPGVMSTSDFVDTGIIYLTYAVLPTIRASVGAVGFYAYVGPSLDFVLDTQIDPSLAFLYVEAGSPLLSGIAGGGLEVRAGNGWSARIEGRFIRNLSVAFEGDFGDMKHQGFEWIIRLGKRRN